MSTLPNRNLEKDILATIMKHRVPIYEAKRALNAVADRLDCIIIPKDIIFRYRGAAKGDQVSYGELLADTSEEDK